MPARRVRRRRTVARRRRGPAISRFGTTVVPDQVMVNLKYADAKVYAGTGAIDQIFRANSLYDPDLTGTGNQPRGFDQWSAFYARYMVVACGITIRVSHNASEPQMVTLIFTPTSMSITSPERASELPYSKTRMVAEYPQQPAVVMSHRMGIKKIRGVRSLVYNYDGALVGANPNSTAYIHVAMNTLSGTVARDTVIQYTLTYRAIMFDRLILSSS